MDLDPPGRIRRLLEHSLDADERARARRLVFEPDRVRYICAHGLMRRLLARYLGASPQAVSYRRAPGGKPYLDAVRTDIPLRFNLSHSGSTALLAVSLAREVGVDLERIRPERDVEGIAEHFFSPVEVGVLRSLAPGELVGAFYHCWTRKEAYIKARGDGLSLPLRSFDVSFAPGAACALLRSAAGAGEPRRWSMLGLTALAGYAAALTVEGRGWTLKAFEWELEGGRRRLQSSWT